ncbi:N-acetylmuramic acid 6-phosphate etherase [Streptomyces sp. W1SF4]|uniref:N-acetylmuramic acid 6-phosphate etherase n=1 Tax=Streptomyces sp. W1SF4 TaxID=2305220 RepID=UPI001F49C3FB|nr:N-acetylmuramic acid 6-phosphate etherase [Streptomyces sp. W1SF4]
MTAPASHAPGRPLRAAYVFDRTLTALTESERDRMLTEYAASGLNTLITKAESVTPELARACRTAGLSLLGSVACFSDHARPAAEQRPNLYPVSGDGRPWQRMEWYTGLVPTDQAYITELADRCGLLAVSPLLDGLVLDFLRWPLHWELELRPGAAPRRSSYDPHTLDDFTRRTGIALPSGSPSATAGHLHAHHEEAWHRYRCEVITDVTRRLTDAIRSARPGLWTGLFLVPAEDGEQRRRLVGQCVAELAPLIDAVLPMSYHAILHREPAFVGLVARSVRTDSGPTAVVPMVQTTNSPVLARGADWGPEITVTDLVGAVCSALDASGDGGLCLFPGEGLDGTGLRLLAEHLRTEDGREHPPLPPTERRNPATVGIDRLPTDELLRAINAEDARVPAAVARALPTLALAVDAAVAALRAGGRVHYVGAGSSGRYAVLDAAELAPTYGLEPGRIVAHLAGGPTALAHAAENAEDDEAAGRRALAQVTARDVVLGLAASGRTPYVAGALAAARAAAATTVLVSCNPDAPLARTADLHVCTDTGPEAITGSTRMKAGSAQKLVLHSFSTAVMVRLGRTWSNLMTDLAATNAKLAGRKLTLLAQATGADPGTCRAVLQEAGGELKTALVVLLTGAGAQEARAALAVHGEVARAAVAALTVRCPGDSAPAT